MINDAIVMATYHFGGIVLLAIAEDVVQPWGGTVGQHTYHFHSDTMLQNRRERRVNTLDIKALRGYCMSCV